MPKYRWALEACLLKGLQSLLTPNIKTSGPRRNPRAKPNDHLGSWTRVHLYYGRTLHTRPPFLVTSHNRLPTPNDLPQYSRRISSKIPGTTNFKWENCTSILRDGGSFPSGMHILSLLTLNSVFLSQRAITDLEIGSSPDPPEPVVYSDLFYPFCKSLVAGTIVRKIASTIGNH